MLGIMSNWGKAWFLIAAESGLSVLSGNISTAIVSSVTQDKPFNPETDLQLGIAYIAVSTAPVDTSLTTESQKQVFIISNNVRCQLT